MGDIIKKNKFADAVADLDKIEEHEREKSEAVISGIAGKSKRKSPEKRKTLPTYIPVSLYEQFSAINKAYGISNNSAINILIRQYVTEKQDILKNM